jgi:ketosteroid isomerase-like protein
MGTPLSQQWDTPPTGPNGVSARMTRKLIAILICTTTVAGCSSANHTLTPQERAAIGDSIKQLIVSTYDLSRPGAVERMMSLYPDTGLVLSANSGRVTTTRAALKAQVDTFWKYVGSNMRNPKWDWTSMHVDVLSPDAAVMTATYRVPHLTPQNMQHVIGGAWTALFVRRGGKWVIVQEHLSDVPTAATPMTMPMPATPPRPPPGG